MYIIIHNITINVYVNERQRQKEQRHRETESLCACHNVCMVITGQLVRTSSLLPLYGSWGLNSGPQAWKQGPLPFEPIYGLILIFLFVRIITPDFGLFFSVK